MARPFPKPEDAVSIAPSTSTRDASEARQIIKGLAASRGVHVGQIVHVTSRRDSRDVKRGDVLVTEMTTPEYVDAMFRAGAVATSTGGITCHAGIIMREMGKPSVVGCGRELLALKTGTWVKVDGDLGFVEVLPD